MLNYLNRIKKAIKSFFIYFYVYDAKPKILKIINLKHLDI